MIFVWAGMGQNEEKRREERLLAACLAAYWVRRLELYSRGRSTAGSATKMVAQSNHHYSVFLNHRTGFVIYKTQGTLKYSISYSKSHTKPVLNWIWWWSYFFYLDSTLLTKALDSRAFVEVAVPMPLVFRGYLFPPVYTCICFGRSRILYSVSVKQGPQN